MAQNNNRIGYVDGLCKCRKDALATLIGEYPEVPGVFGRMTTFFTVLSQRLDGVEVKEEKLQYKMLLAVSFMRTHICACEHIFNSENIEGITLLRKQLELIARMREAEIRDTETLYDKVPNVVYGRPMNVLYGNMSKVAHNANLESLDMLGYRMQDENHKHICLYPVYNEGTIDSFSVAIGQFMMFAVEAIHLQSDILSEYNIQEDGEMIMEFIRFGKMSKIPFFLSLDVED